MSTYDLAFSQVKRTDHKFLLISDLRNAAVDAYWYKLDYVGHILDGIANFLMNNDDVTDNELVRFRVFFELINRAMNKLNDNPVAFI